MGKPEHMRIRAVVAASVAALAALGATGCGSVLHQGDVTPDSVEQKARTLTQQTLDALRPVIGSAGTSVDRAAWQQCTTETPGQHRFEYSYVLTLDVPAAQSKAAMDAAKAHFAREGFTPGVPDPKTPRVTANDPHSSWWVAVGVSDGDTSMFISVDSSCVFTRHDPKTTGSR